MARGSAVTWRCQLLTVDRAFDLARRAATQLAAPSPAGSARRPTSAPSARATSPPRSRSRRAEAAAWRHRPGSCARRPSAPSDRRRSATRRRRRPRAARSSMAALADDRGLRHRRRRRSRSSRSLSRRRDQAVDEFEIVLVHGPVQRRRAVGFWRVHVDALGDRAPAPRRACRPI